MAKNPYEILGIGKSASEADIKAAYRKLAKKFHPDLNPGNKEADVKFKELNSANDLLSDKDKRAAFDRGEMDAAGQPRQAHHHQQQYYRDFAESARQNRYGSGGREFDLSDLEGLFSGFGGMGGFGGMSRGGSRASNDVHYTIEVTFLEAARGAKKRVTMPDGKSLELMIPEGIDEGQQLRLKGQGNAASKAASAGDAYGKIHILPHRYFTREGMDITAEVPMALYESVLGGRIQVPTIHGPVEMNIPKGAASGMKLRLKGRGIKGGDQYVKLKLAMPEKIDAELEQAIHAWSEKHPYNPRKSMEKAE